MVITCHGVPLRWLTDGWVPTAPEPWSPGQTLRIGQTDELEGKVERTGPWRTGVVMKERIRRLEPLLRTLFLSWIYCEEEDQNVNLAICNFWSQGKTVGRAFQTLAIDNHFLWSFSERPHLICKWVCFFFGFVFFSAQLPKRASIAKIFRFPALSSASSYRLCFGVSLSTDSSPY